VKLKPRATDLLLISIPSAPGAPISRRVRVGDEGGRSSRAVAQPMDTAGDHWPEHVLTIHPRCPCCLSSKRVAWRGRSSMGTRGNCASGTARGRKISWAR